MIDDVLIRDAIDADLAAITDIFNQAIPDGNAEWTERLHTVDERRVWLEARRRSGRPVIVAERGGQTGAGVIGVASYGDFRDSDLREGFRFVCEHSVYVDRAARASGVADRLMDELIERAHSNGLRQMVATIDASNPASIGFHLRRGFIEVGRMPDIGYTFGTWRTMVLMQLDLNSPTD